MFRAVPLSIIRSFSLYTQQWYTSYSYQDQDPSWSCSQAAWHIPLLCVQWKSPDDGQRNCPKHVEFYYKNKFEILVHLVGFVIRSYDDARSDECQIGVRMCCTFTYCFVFSYNFWGPNQFTVRHLIFHFSYSRPISVPVTLLWLTFSPDYGSPITKHKWCYFCHMTPHIRAWSLFTARGYKFFRPTIGCSLPSVCYSVSSQYPPKINLRN